MVACSTRLDAVFVFLAITYFCMPSEAYEIAIDDAITAHVGETVVITCNSSLPSSSTYSLIWSLNGQQIIRCGTRCSLAESGRRQLRVDRSRSSSTLKIRHVETSDSGTYVCTIHADRTNDATVQLSVRECDHSIPSVNCPRNVSSGQVFSVTCDEGVNDQVTEYRPLVVNHTMQLSLLSQTSSGVYEVRSDGEGLLRPGDINTPSLNFTCCRTESCHGNVCSDMCGTLITYPPTQLSLIWSRIGPFSESTNEGGLSITCGSHGSPAPVVTWMMDSSLVILESNLTSSTLHFPAIHRNISDVYLCSADNGIPPSMERRVTVNVQYAPEIATNVTSVVLDEGSGGSIRCVIDANPAASSITWTSSHATLRGIDRILSRTDYRVVTESRLDLANPIKKQMFGNYTCSATNPEGAASHTIQLLGNTFPEPPAHLVVVNYSESSLTVKWGSGEPVPTLATSYAVTWCDVIRRLECTTRTGLHSTEYTVRNLEDASVHSISVSARNRLGASENNPVINATTSPRSPLSMGIRATYSPNRRRLAIGQSAIRIRADICLYIEFEFAGSRYTNNTCLMPGTHVSLDSRGRPVHLWLVACLGKVCGPPSLVQTEDDTVPISPNVEMSTQDSEGGWVVYTSVIVSGVLLIVILALVVSLVLFKRGRSRERHSMPSDSDAMALRINSVSESGAISSPPTSPLPQTPPLYTPEPFAFRFPFLQVSQTSPPVSPSAQSNSQIYAFAESNYASIYERPDVMKISGMNTISVIESKRENLTQSSPAMTSSDTPMSTSTYLPMAPITPKSDEPENMYSREIDFHPAKEPVDSVPLKPPVETPELNAIKPEASSDPYCPRGNTDYVQSMVC